MTTFGDIEVFCPGMLEVLSVGKGDLKIQIGCEDPKDIEDGRKLIEEMLRKGYSIFVETDSGPSRVKKFNPKRMTYIVSDLGEEPSPNFASPIPAGGKPAPTTKKRGVVEREIPVRGSRARSIGRTAGG